MAHWLHYVKTWRHPQNRKYIMHCTVARGGANRSHGKFREIWICGFWDMPADRQTDKQTNKNANTHSGILIAVLCATTVEGKVISKSVLSNLCWIHANAKLQWTISQLLVNVIKWIIVRYRRRPDAHLFLGLPSRLVFHVSLVHLSVPVNLALHLFRGHLRRLWDRNLQVFQADLWSTTTTVVGKPAENPDRKLLTKNNQ